MQTANLDAWWDAQRKHSRSHACSSAKNVAPSAYVCLLVLTETSICAHAITRPIEGSPSVLNYITQLLHQYCPPIHIYLSILPVLTLATHFLRWTSCAIQSRLYLSKSFMVSKKLNSSSSYFLFFFLFWGNKCNMYYNSRKCQPNSIWSINIRPKNKSIFNAWHPSRGANFPT